MDQEKVQEKEEKLTKKEKRMFRREERDQGIATAQRKKKITKIAWIVGITFVLAGIVSLIWYVSKNTSPKGEDKSIAIAVLPDRGHVPDGTTVHDYNSNPPTSGPHWKNPLPGGKYNDEQADEALVHNLEHGHIWISYRPSIPEEIKKQLEGFASRKVLVTPRSKNDTDIVLAAWGRMDKFNIENNSIDKKRIENFIARYINKGPEFVP